MLFGGEDYNNYRNNNELLKGPNRIAISRRKRQIINTMYQPNYGPIGAMGSPYAGPGYAMNGPMNGPYPSSGYSRNYYGDDSRLLDNPNFVNLVFATTQVSVTIIAVVIGLFATISLAVSGSLSSFLIRVYVWISFLIILITIVFAVYLCSSMERNTNFQQRHLMIMYRFYNPNDFKSFSTHFIDTLQVHLECCGSNSPADFNFIIGGTSVATISNALPRSCCARNRDELIAPWIRGRPTPFVGSSGVYGPECSITIMPEEHRKGCLNLVRNMVQTWYTVIMLWCLLTVIFLLISIITGNQIKSQNDYITAGR